MQTVCLIGKPNVGKSSIFNRLIKEKKAIILDTPGITRDRLYGICEYKGKKFSLIDTGGIIFGENTFDQDILAQATLAMDEADQILFVVDGLNEVDHIDLQIRDLLRKYHKNVFVVVNKIDNEQRENNIYSYYELGYENVFPVSCEHNKGFNKLLDALTANMPLDIPLSDPTLKFCLIGRPNVGKSSLINALLNEERVIVSPISGTTRDAIDTKFTYNHEEYIAIDTAGMRKKGKIYENIEKYSLIRSLKAIERSDVCLLILDAKEGIIEHDKHIASYALNLGKAIVIVVNKWDTIKNPNQEISKWQELIRDEFKFIPYAPIVFLSAKERKRIAGLMPEILKAYEHYTLEIPTSTLNNIIREAIALHEPPSYKGQRLRVYFVHQTGIKPVKITLEVNNKKLVHFSYERYLENKIRENIDLEGTPIILQFKNKIE